MLVVLLGLGFAVIPLSRGEIFYYWDNAQQHFAQTAFLSQALREGSIPQWWPHVGFGEPTVAEGQSAHYHPLRLLLALIFTTPAAFMWEIGLCVGAAGIGTYLYLRQFHIRPEAGVVGALCHMFGSFSVVFIRNVALLRAFCLLPLAMFLSERFVRSKRLRYAVLASLVFSLQLLAGHPTYFVVTVVATATYVVCRLSQRSWHRGEPVPVAGRRLFVTLLLWGGAVALGMGIAAIQFLPQLLHVNESIRQGGLNFEYAMSMSAQLRYLPQALFPYVFAQGDWLDHATAWGSMLNLVPSSGIYLGAVATILPLLALWWHRGWKDVSWALVVCGLVGLALALGDKAPLFPALWSLPGLNGLRYPHRFLLWCSFCLACLAALGVHRTLARSRLGRLHGHDVFPFAAYVGVLLLLGIVFWTQTHRLAAAVHVALDYRAGLLISSTFIVAALILTSGLFLGRSYHTVILILIAILAFSDLWLFRVRSGYAVSAPVDEVLAPPELARLLRQDHEPFHIMSIIPGDLGLSQNQDLKDFLQADTVSIWGIDSGDAYFSLFSNRYFIVREAMVHELLHSPEAGKQLAPFLGALNVKYLVAPSSIEFLGLQRTYQSAKAAVWKNPLALPPAYLVGRALPSILSPDPQKSDQSAKRLSQYFRMVSDAGSRLAEAQIIDHLIESQIDFRTTAMIEGSDMPRLDGVLGRSEIRRRTVEADEMHFEVDVDREALLVISSKYYPGWSAYVNGKSAKIYRTNYITMGVPVPAGRSSIDLYFATPGFRLGAVVTFLSLLLAGFVLWANPVRLIDAALRRAMNS